MDPQNTGSITPEPQTPAPAAPAAPTEPTNQPAPAPSTEPSPAAPEATPPAEGTQPTAPADPAQPAAPAPAQPEAPRESAAQKRARELRAEIDGKRALADRLDPPRNPAAPPAAPAPAPQAPATPAPVQSQPEAPDYYDPTDGTIDPAKLAAYNARETARQVQAALDARDRQAAIAANRQAIAQQVDSYASRIEAEAQYLATNVPELNPSKDNPEYDKELDDQIEADYRRMTTDSQGNLVRIDISLQEYALSQVKLARRYKTNGAASIPNSQAAAGVDAAITPGTGTAATPGGKSIAEMTDKEYEAHLKAKGVKTVQR